MLTAAPMRKLAGSKLKTTSRSPGPTSTARKTWLAGSSGLSSPSTDASQPGKWLSLRTRNPARVGATATSTRCGSYRVMRASPAGNRPAERLPGF